MNCAQLIKEIRCGALDTDTAAQLFGAMLDDGLPELELGAILLALATKIEAASELVGFEMAVADRTHQLVSPAPELHPVVMPSLNGARRQRNLTPLVALALARHGVPVLVHGPLEGFGGVGIAAILRELGVAPCATLLHAQAALQEARIAFVPTGVLAPGLGRLLALRARLGVASSARAVAKLVDPFRGEGLRVIGVSHPDRLDRLRELLLVTRNTALLFSSPEGESYAGPHRRPRLEFFRAGESRALFEQARLDHEPAACLPREVEAHATAEYIRRVLDDAMPLPLPIANQVACCLYASGYADELAQAQAIVAAGTRCPSS